MIGSQLGKFAGEYRAASAASFAGIAKTAFLLLNGGAARYLGMMVGPTRPIWQAEPNFAMMPAAGDCCKQ
jgi:hypothetical protein